jgi:hypothetical protein
VNECKPLAQGAAVDPTVFGLDDEVMQMSEKAFACNAQKALEDLTTMHHKTGGLDASHKKNVQDKVRYATFGLKLIKAGRCRFIPGSPQVHPRFTPGFYLGSPQVEPRLTPG